MRASFRSLLLVVLLVSATGLSASVEHVRRAQAKLGIEVWSQVVEIENKVASSVYPRTTYALVFEFNLALWIYTPHDGTQSLSLYKNRLAQDKSDLQPLLREIHRGFTRFKVLADGAELSWDDTETLPNGCFIESLASARALAATGERLLRAAILLYYAKGPVRQGHAVFAYETSRGVYIDDIGRENPKKLSGKWSDQALNLARRYLPSLREKLVAARFVPVSVDAPLSPAVVSFAPRTTQDVAENVGIFVTL